MPEAVLFDFGGTLDADGRRWSDRFHDGYLAVGGQLDPQRFEGWFAVSDRLLARTPGVAGLGFTELVAVQTSLLCRLLPDGERLDSLAWGKAFTAESFAMAARNRPMLDLLGQHFELGVVSNFSGNLRPCLAELGLEDAFSVVFDSAVVGMRKPDLRLFAAAFDALGRRAEECWMVGDNPFVDIEPAARLGCGTCWLTPSARAPVPGISPTHRITMLTELPALLAVACTR